MAERNSEAAAGGHDRGDGPGAGHGQAGRGMAADIADQPDVFARLLDTQAPAIAAIAATIATRQPKHVVFTARGTSDHAALYGSYLTEIRLGRPAGLASPSAITVYGARPDLRDALVIAVSQSGGSPDLAEVIRVAREQGALTLAVTNAPGSPLAEAAELHLDIAAGAERAVAATKTYTAELLALLLLVEAIRAPGSVPAELAALPELARQALADDTAVQLAPRYRFAGQVVTTGRGYAYPTAREAALKLMETSYLSAQAFSGADLLHGPLATVDPQVPVLAIVPDGAGGAAMLPVLARLTERNADVFGVGAASALESLAGGIVLPGGVTEELSPLLEILPLQQLALHLAVARGGDPDTPRGLRKVTETL